MGDRDVNCILYNIFLCHLKLNNFRKAYEVFVKEIITIDNKLQQSHFNANFSHLLFQAMKNSSSKITGIPKILSSEDKLPINSEDKIAINSEDKE